MILHQILLWLSASMFVLDVGFSCYVAGSQHRCLDAADFVSCLSAALFCLVFAVPMFDRLIGAIVCISALALRVWHSKLVKMRREVKSTTFIWRNCKDPGE